VSFAVDRKQGDKSMNAIVVVEFTYEISRGELEEIALDFADNVKPIVDGLIWKIFLDRSETGRSAGVYLFADKAAAQAYADGPIVSGLRSAPGLSDVSAKTFEVLDKASLRAGAPLQNSTAMVK
jgi:hypothetical protein